VILLLAAGPPNPTQIGPCVLQPSLGSLLLVALGATNTSGVLATNVPLPADPSLAGGVMTTQALIVVTSGPLPGIGELTNGARMTFGF
jgi:hypothetical protein